MRLVARIFFQTLIALGFFVGAFFLFETGGTLAVVLGWGAIVVGVAILAELIVASAFGRLRTPEDYGAGFVVPPYRRRPWFGKEGLIHRQA
ncbi:hypothetical protein B841_12555 [Corynebacterium maris DSM 45190]|uniref:Uncharacterized protein n=1 Tax=Corynebacterium maris DSM 45190 TaxID=1224163 RepID=S5TMF4_9CORY|nr:hypothetical protein [Corynebacterium maris]AGS35981.1 hypothetical protein B841_12555 [Corynebacterium maris DSM 45190]